MTQKSEKNIPKFYFCIRSPTFLTHMPCPFKICFTNKVNTIRGGGQLLVTGSHYRVSGSHVPGLQSRGPGSQVSESQGPGSQSLGSLGPGSLGPDFRLCLFTEQLQTTASDFYTNYFIGVSAYVVISGNFIQIWHYVKNVQIRSFFWSLFSPHSDWIRTRKNPVLEHFPRSFDHSKTVLKKMSSKFYWFLHKVIS